MIISKIIPQLYNRYAIKQRKQTKPNQRYEFPYPTNNEL